MELWHPGLGVQTVGAALLSAIFLYLSRGRGNRVLQAAGIAWFFLFLSVLSLLLLEHLKEPWGWRLFQYFKILYIVTMCVAAIRLDRDVSLAKPLSVAAIAAIPFSLMAVGQNPAQSIYFFDFHLGVLAVGWLVLAVYIFQSPRAGLGRQFAGLLALVTAGAHLIYIIVVNTSPTKEPLKTLGYTQFLDVLLEMLFGIGLIIWAMEDTERRLAALHARTVDDTRRSQRRAWLDPLTETHNRFFLDEIRPQLEASEQGGSIVLIDVDGLKRINDEEGHEEGDKAIWTVATAIKKLVRGNDHVIRWGGDEFLVILPGMEEELARKRFYMMPAKMDEVKQSTKPGSKPYTRFLAASVGVHPYSKRAPLDLAISQADRVMYERKRAHRELRGPGGGERKP
ncbi:MAG TPA: GGDEF domain-containing protein [Thermoanaerobaculia bacterium]|jgi:diguanylate cyclase (GGDEF)-like protein